MSTHPGLLSHKHRKLIILSLLVTAAAYLLVAGYVGLDKVSIAFGQIGLSGWLFLLSCSLLNYLLRFFRWQMYLSVLGHRLHQGLHFLYYLAGFALTTTPAKAGETIRSVLLRPHGVSYPQSLASFFSERLLDVIVVASLASLTILAFTDYQGFVMFGILLIFGLLIIVRSQWLIKLLKVMGNQVKAKKIQRLLEHSTSLLSSAHQFLVWRRLITGYLIGFIAWSIQGLAFYFIVTSLNFEISLYAAMGIYSISLLAGAVSFIPGGIGSTELAMGLLLASLGADNTIVISAPLISRLSTLWFAVLLGLISTTLLSTKLFRSQSD